MDRENAMSSKSIHPSTMTGIKRLAKKIKATQGLSHSASLDNASVAAGYQNFRHAQKAPPGLTPPAAVTPAYRLFLTAYWRNREAGTTGRETLTITLAAPWADLLTRAEIKSARGIENFIPEGPDHLSKRSIVDSQSNAREAVCHAARTLQFVAATRLRPSSGYNRAYPKGNVDNHVPGQDHACVWFDQGKRYLIADEPYEAAANHRRQERATWCRVNGYTELQSSWPGMHNPFGGTRLYLISNTTKGVPLEPLTKALGQLPMPYSASDWKGESAPRFPYFVSPGAIEEDSKARVSQKAAKARLPDGKPATLKYTQTLVGPRRRPNGRMPIETHKEVGRLLKGVLVVIYYRKGAYNRVNAVRSDLDEWTMREYDRSALPDNEFFDLYYHEQGNSPRKVTAGQAQDCIANLRQVEEMLTKHYPDSAPLRRLIKLLRGGTKAIEAWAQS
jgi:hypothetical protein